MKQPQCFVISHPSSSAVRDCYNSLSKWNWRFEKFDAVDGRKLTKKDWDRIGVKMSATAGKLPDRPGAQGCFFSHFALWEKCFDDKKAMVIFEHDAVVTDSWPEDLNIDSCIVKLYKTAECKEKVDLGVWSKGSHAYTITPEHAKQLLDKARNFGASPVDKHIISNITPWRFLDYDLVIKNPRRGASTTSGHI